MTPTTLVVLAAGMGSRFGSRIKQLEPIGLNGELIIDYSITDAMEAGFDKVVFIIRKDIEQLFRETIGDRISKIVETEYVFQETSALPVRQNDFPDRTKPWGTAQALCCCRDVLCGNFGVINADDYYGKSAFKQTADFLKSNTDDYCMTGFRLVNTLTENGYVSRGVCEIENGELKSVTERTKIIDCKYTEDDGESWTALPPDTVVSMNLWGFMPDLFDYASDGFKAFLSERINEPKAEYYLPTVVSGLIASGEKRVKVLVAEDKWYGVTYKEDKQSVSDAINKMAEDGVYKGL